MYIQFIYILYTYACIVLVMFVYVVLYIPFRNDMGDESLVEPIVHRRNIKAIDIVCAIN